MKKYSLLIILPPPHIEAEIIKIREILFKRRRLLSSQALPAFIPLLYLPEELRYIDNLKNSLQSINEGFQINSKQPELLSRYYYLTVRTNGRWHQMVHRLRQILYSPGSGYDPDFETQDPLIEIHEGFFLGEEEGRITDNPEVFIESLMRESVRFQFDNPTLGILHIEQAQPETGKWEEIYWTLDKIKALPPTKPAGTDTD